MKGFLLLGVGAFLAGGATAVALEQRSRVDREYGEDRNWPAVPYTAATHPDSPQEKVSEPEAAAAPLAEANPVEPAATHAGTAPTEPLNGSSERSTKD